ncbi:MAG: AarF/ABC1/UbiB kinase family protein [Proteobacteria bacterium]|nr:AarF/ABC1/UbiB kinase family protein [Pseudomonadota bacterium]
MTKTVGLRVYIPGRSRSRLADANVHFGTVPLHIRDPERQWPPDLNGEVPTPLAIGGKVEGAPIELDPLPPAAQSRMMWTVGQFAGFLAKGAWRSITRRKSSEEEKAVLLRELFERLSGMWIKLGQLLSLRTDILSVEMCRELSKLQFEVKGFPNEVSRRVLEEELGKPIASVFAYFEEHPFAAASVAQVHRATLLRNNRAVVVKIMRPDVAQSFERDLRLLHRIVVFSRVFGIWKRLRLTEAARELREVLTEETNYEREAVNLRRMRKSLRKHGIYVPRVISGLSSKRVLVIEEVPGVLMSHYIRARREDPSATHAWEINNGIDVKSLARDLAISVLRQILEDNQFHGDLHPGNLIMLADNGLALIDFGSVGRLDRRLWMLYRDSLAAIAMQDYERAADIMLMMSPMPSLANTTALRRDMTFAMRQWEMNGQFSGATYADRSIAAMSERIAKVMANHNVPLAWGIMRVGRTLSTLDASLQTLWPKADFLKLCQAYFRDRARRNATPRGRMEQLRMFMMEASSVAGDARLLVGSGLREQALRLHGVMDRVTHIRVVIASWAIRGGWIMLIALAFSAYIDEGRDRIEVGEPWPLAKFLHIEELAGAVPDLHPGQWAALLILAIFLIRFFRATRRSIAGND